jgi:TolB-like protein/DNA-binding winged helix-turn-helix (wHTH) protein/tetratricopeptide (TPR) repeat protein
VPPSHLYSFGQFRIDPNQRVLFRDGEVVPLTPKAFDTLLLLVENHGRVLEKDALIKKVWPDSFVEEGSLTRNVSVLRKVLEEGLPGQECIETIPKRGYRFVAEVHVLERATDPAALPPRPSHSRAYALSAGTVAIVLLLFGGVWWWRSRSHAALHPQRVMLVVLPVQNLTGDPDKDYVSDGMTEEIIAQLSSLNPAQLGVIARTSSMTYKKTSKTVDQIGRELGVDHVLETSLRESHGRYLVTAQLIRTSDQTHIWAQDFEGAFGDVLSLQNDLAYAVAQQTRVTFTPQQKEARRATVRRVDPQAYDAYLKGRFYWNKRTEAGMYKAIEHFQQATRLDPDYAPGYAGLASTYALLYWYSSARPQDVYPKGKAAAERALKLDDTLAEPHATLGLIHLSFDWDWEAAGQEFRRAIELDPNYATAHHWFAIYLYGQGQREESLREMRLAERVDPLSLPINTDLGVVLYQLHRYDESLRQLKQTIELDPNYSDAFHALALTHAAKAEYPQAIAAAEKAVRLAPGDPIVLAELGYVYAVAGKENETRAILKQLSQGLKDRPRAGYSLALVYAGLKDRNHLYEWLDKTYREHAPEILNITAEPMFDPFRADPQFRDIVRHLGLPQ